MNINIEINGATVDNTPNSEEKRIVEVPRIEIYKDGTMKVCGDFPISNLGQIAASLNSYNFGMNLGLAIKEFINGDEAKFKEIESVILAIKRQDADLPAMNALSSWKTGG